MDALSLIATIAGAVLVIALALHVWYAIGLSRVIAAHGGEAWRAWVPLVNEAEVFRLGRLDPVRAVLLIVPLVNVYGLVLKARAANRLGEVSGRGPGTTALAVVLPPAWAMLLSRNPQATDAGASAPERITVTEPGSAGEAEGPISAIPGMPDAATSTGAPTPTGAAGGGRRATPERDVSYVVPVLPGPRDIGADAPGATSEPAPAADLDGTVAETAAPASGASTPVGPASTAPVSGASTAVGPASTVPVSGASTAVGPASTVPVSGASTAVGPASTVPVSGASTPVASLLAGAGDDAAVTQIPDGLMTRAAASAAARPETARTQPHDSTDDGDDRVSETTDSTAERSAGRTDVAAPVDESTQTARPRSRRRGEWTLALPDATAVPLTGRTVVLGRKPSNADETVQYVAVHDDSRTMSKEHARLDWTVTGWTITDLDSTNGVTLVHDDGRVERLAGGGSAPVPTRFRLGDAGLELRPVAG